jgi:hypothetical protein
LNRRQHKDFLRSAAARTQAALYDAIAIALETITARDRRNLFRSCGYRLREM